ncbi:YrzE family protein [uncultured Microbacterium sp.]|uniref:general stress protein n=1 Tax=uncultured Microbacterium sp. TaxID=191216 RepID=UPI0025D70447|nr:YrzE family protein [uncultured Microbacterium sp.]
MSMFAQRPGAGRDEVGEKIASFPTYEQAQKAVSSLIAGEVPARDIAIVGSGLRSIERITGKLGYATAARSGALNGLMLGLLFAFIFVLGMPTVQISAFIGVLLVGMALGMILSLGTYSIVRRRRDFASVMQVAADHYDVCVAATSVHKARGIVGPSGTAARTVVSRPATSDTAPPQYGERRTPGAPGPQGERPATESQRPAPSAPQYGERVTPGTPAPVAPPRPPAPTPEPANNDDDRPRYGERVPPPSDDSSNKADRGQ